MRAWFGAGKARTVRRAGFYWWHETKGRLRKGTAREMALLVGMAWNPDAPRRVQLSQSDVALTVPPPVATRLALIARAWAQSS